jgi:hypothetical protein
MDQRCNVVGATASTLAMRKFSEISEALRIFGEFATAGSVAVCVARSYCADLLDLSSSTCVTPAVARFLRRNSLAVHLGHRGSS